PEIGSELVYGPSVATWADGMLLNRYILNEMGKMEKMSIADCWDKVKPCLHLDNGLEIIGKSLFESTIEEMNDEQLAEIISFWKGSNILDKDENGRTETGMYRLFINSLDAASPDKWGFPKEEDTLAFLKK